MNIKAIRGDQRGIPVKALDIETRSLVDGHPEYALQPWRVCSDEAEITMIAIGGSDYAEFVDEVASDTYVCWNALFDMTFLAARGVDITKSKWLDAMLLCKWAENCQDNDKLGYSLVKCAKRWLQDWELLEKFIKLKETEADPSYDKYWKVRAKLDVMATHLIATKALRRLTPQQKRSAMIEAGNLVPNALAYLSGVPTNERFYSEPIPGLQKEMAEIECRLGVANPGSAEAQLGGDGWLPSKILRSPPQLAETLYKTWGLPCKHTTEKGAPATDKTALTYLADKDDKALEILRWRHLNTRLTKFCQSPAKAAKYLGSSRLHPEPKVFSTYTGRYTYGSKSGKNLISMALHQIPRGPDVRRMVEAPKGKMLVEFDASGQEARLLAEIGDVYSMLDVFQGGKKIHAVMGASIAGIPYDEFMRRYKAGEESYAGPEGLYYCGKFCIAQGQLVDTDRGPIAIENVAIDDLVWDGVEFVTHDGVVCNGLKDVVEIDGITATPDHKVLTNSGWMELQHVSENEIIRAHPPREWEADSSLDSAGQYLLSKATLAAKKAVRSLFSLPVQVRDSTVHLEKQPYQQQDHSMQELCSQPWGYRSDVCQAVSRDSRSVYQPIKSKLSQLRSQRYYEQVQGCEAVLRLHEADIPEYYNSGFEDVRDRSSKQRSRLRDRECSISDEAREPSKYTPQPSGELSWPRGIYRRLVAFTKARLSRLRLYHSVDEQVSERWQVDRRDLRDGSTPAVQRRKALVYDIVNAGPRHRFTVQGKIVSNCNLSMQYRVGAAKHRVMARVQYGLQKDMTTINRWRSLYHSTYPEVKTYWQRAINLARTRGYAETLAGRRYYITKWDAENRWSSESSAINFPIQGSGADMKNLAITQLAKHFPQFEFVFDVHDGIFVWADKNKQGMQDVLAAKEMLNAMDYEAAWGWKPRIPLTWDASVGVTWGEMKEI